MCDGVIDLRSPMRALRVRGFQPPWRTVYVYACPLCGAEHRVRAGSFNGRQPTPGVGAIRCEVEVSDAQP